MLGTVTPNAKIMTTQMNNLEKAASILICLGVEKAAQVLSYLSNDEVQLVAAQMTHTGRIPKEVRLELIQELKDRSLTVDYHNSKGGLAFVHSLLSQTFGEERASMVLEQLTQRKVARPFNSLRSVDAHRLLDIISNEHPSVIALVLYYLPRDKAASILAGLADAIRHEVVMRMVNLQRPQPQMVSRLEQIIAQNLSDSGGEDEERDYGNMTGARTLVEILGRVDPGVERRVYEFLQQRDPALAEEVRKSMFVFEDIAKLDRIALPLVLRELSSQEIAMALKGSEESLKSLIYANVSENSAKNIKEEIDLMGPIRVSQVEEAQQKVVSVVRRLAELGTITMRAAEEGDLVE